MLTSDLKIEIAEISGWGRGMHITIDKNKTEINYPKGSVLRDTDLLNCIATLKYCINILQL